VRNPIRKNIKSNQFVLNKKRIEAIQMEFHQKFSSSQRQGEKHNRSYQRELDFGLVNTDDLLAKELLDFLGQESLSAAACRGSVGP
jgi:hypothetical protein